MFISYSRTDGAFARRLHAALGAQGRDVWTDWEDIPSGMEWDTEIARGIDAGDVFIFVLSPESVRSLECARELARAVEGGKRLVPLLLGDVDPSRIPEPLRPVQWSDFRVRDNFDAGVAGLADTLDADLDWLREHTRLALRAQQWQRSAGDRSLLLRGRELVAAEGWLGRHSAAAGRQATESHAGYIAAGRRAESRRQRTTIAVTGFALVVALGLATFAFLQRQQALREATVARSRELAAKALAELVADPDRAVGLARAAADVKETPEAIEALRSAVRASHIVSVLRGHQGRVVSAGFSPRGDRVLTASADGSARVWDAVSGRLLFVVRHRDAVSAAVYAPGGATIATASADGTARLSRAADGRALATLAVGAPVAGVAFSPDGKRVVTAAANGGRVWRVSDGIALARLGDADVRDARFDLDGASVLTIASDAARLWRASDGRLRHTLLQGYPGGPRGHVLSGAFSRDGRLVVTTGDDGQAIVWNAATGRQVSSGRNADTGVVATATFSPDGRMVAMAAEGVTAVWHVRLGLGDLGQRALALGARRVTARSVEFSRNGRLLLTTDDGGALRAWRARDGRQVAVLTRLEGVHGATFDTDAHRAVAVTSDVAVVVRVVSGEEVEQLGTPNNADVSPDGQRLLADGASGAWLWETRAWRRLRRLPRTTGVGLFGFSVDGTAFAADRDDRTTIVWRARTGARAGTVHVPGRRAPQVFIGPRAATALVSADQITEVRIRDGRQLGVVERPPDFAEAFYLADGRIATTTLRGRMWIRSRADAPPTVAIDAHRASIEPADVSADGRVLVTRDLSSVSEQPDTAHGRGIVRVWDTHSGDALAVLRHRRHVSGASLSGDGSIALTATDDEAALWSVDGGRRLRTLAHPSQIVDARLSRDGAIVATSSADGVVRRWSAADGTLLDRRTLPEEDSGIISLSPNGRILAVEVPGRAYVFDCEVCLPASGLRALAKRRTAQALRDEPRAG